MFMGKNGVITCYAIYSALHFSAQNQALVYCLRGNSAGILLRLCSARDYAIASRSLGCEGLGKLGESHVFSYNIIDIVHILKKLYHCAVASDIFNTTRLRAVNSIQFSIQLFLSSAFPNGIAS